MPDAAADLLRLVRDGELGGWRGLPATLTLAELTSTFPRDSDWSGTAQLGGRHRQTTWLWAVAPGTGQQLRVWFDADRVVLVDFACAGTVSNRPDDLAALLGEAPAALDTWLGTLPLPESELVFARHGLAAFVNRETQSIWHLALFCPQSLHDYTDNFRIDMQVRRHQPRPSADPGS